MKINGWVIGSLLLVIISATIFVWTLTIPPTLQPNVITEDTPTMGPGNFITLNDIHLSMYITRMVKGLDDAPGVCFIQQRIIDKAFFENCVQIDIMEDTIKHYKGSITSSNLYKGRVLE
jgi:hypothetical protein